MTTCRGLSNPEIDPELCIAPAPVRTQVVSSLMKLGVRDRARLVVAAFSSGFVVAPRCHPDG